MGFGLQGPHDPLCRGMWPVYGDQGDGFGLQGPHDRILLVVF